MAHALARRAGQTEARHSPPGAYGAALAASLALVLSACSFKLPGSGVRAGSTSGGGAPVVGSRGIASGADRILGDTSPFDTASVRGALSGFEVDERLLDTGQGLKRMFIASSAGDPAAEIYPDPAGQRVARIDVVGKSIAGPDGLRVGSALHLQPRKGFGCAPGGPEGLRGRAICARADDARLTYIYDHGWFEADDALPPANILVHAKLVRIIWTAPSS